MDAEAKNPTPALSVVIPVHNGAVVLERCLIALRKSTFTEYECVVVDDGSTDDSGEVAHRHGARVLRLQGKNGPAYARNRGAETAAASIILFLDSDVCVHANTVEKVVQYFELHPEVHALFGSYDDRPTDQGFISQYKNLFHHYIHQSAKQQASTFWAGCGAIRRDVFLEVRGFDETYRRPSIEDIELGFRLQARGMTIHLVKDIQATHLKRWTFWNLLRTDVFDRAIPWTLLMLRDRTVPVDLNLRFAHQLSVVILYGLLLIAASGPMWGSIYSWGDLFTMTAVVGVACGILILLNRNLYFFFAEKQSWRFAIRALPIHWLYYVYSGAAVAVAISLHLWNGRISHYRQG